MRDRRHETAVAYPELEAWLVELDIATKRPRTIYAYARTVAALLRAHPEKRFEAFDHRDVMDALRAVPPRSRHITRSIFNGWFAWGVRDERITRNPVDKVPQIKAPRQRPTDIFTEAERAALEALPTPDGELWTILFGTGLRRGEARRLQRRNVDLNRTRLAVISGKGDKDALVPFFPEVAQAIARLDLLERLEPTDHFWYLVRYPVGDHRRRRDPIGDTTFDKWYRRGIDAAGVRYLNPHQTRHTYGWWLRGLEFPIEERAFLMRHEKIDTTKRFYDRTSVDEVADRMARYSLV